VTSVNISDRLTLVLSLVKGPLLGLAIAASSGLKARTFGVTPSLDFCASDCFNSAPDLFVSEICQIGKHNKIHDLAHSGRLSDKSGTSAAGDKPVTAWEIHWTLQRKTNEVTLVLH
jgi:hypothetical protein